MPPAGLAAPRLSSQPHGAVVVPLGNIPCTVALFPIRIRSELISLQLGLHTILRHLHPDYADFTSVSNVRARLQWPLENATATPTGVPSYVVDSDGTRRANAVLLMLARNSELEGALSSVTQLEERFNHRYNYSWVFLNEVPFTDEFKE